MLDNPLAAKVQIRLDAMIITNTLAFLGYILNTNSNLLQVFIINTKHAFYICKIQHTHTHYN